MTFSVGHVQGGTGAGRKRPLLERQCVPWACECLVQSHEQSRVLACKLNPGYLVRCIDCGAERDGGR